MKGKVEMNQGDVVTFTSRLVVEECCNCGVIFGLPDDLRKHLLDKPGTAFYCPNGHQQWYVGKSEAQKLRERLTTERERTEFWREEHHREKRSHSATKGQLTKARNRIGKGVCPCCNRSFPALAEHMRTEHPEFSEP